MNANQIVSTLKTRKGQHVKAIWQRTLKTRKDCPHIITKHTIAWIRAGIDYANLSAVKSGIESGERGEVQGLPWGEWVEFPFIITHTPKGATEAVEYVRFYPATFANLKNEVHYFKDGKPARKEDVQPLCLASEFSKPDDDKPDCFTVKAESVLAIE